MSANEKRVLSILKKLDGLESIRDRYTGKKSSYWVPPRPGRMVYFEKPWGPGHRPSKEEADKIVADLDKQIKQLRAQLKLKEAGI